MILTGKIGFLAYFLQKRFSRSFSSFSCIFINASNLQISSAFLVASIPFKYKTCMLLVPCKTCMLLVSVVGTPSMIQMLSKNLELKR